MVSTLDCFLTTQASIAFISIVLFSSVSFDQTV